VLVNNAAQQMTHESIDEISDEEWQRTFAVNIHAMFYLVKAALPHMQAGGSIINTSSINSDNPRPDLLALCHHQGCDRQFLGRPCPAARREGHPRELGRAGPDLDPAHSQHHAGG
jgi:NAD(P)-dependent dehydrogenase (short-subunit alcohol dehydrogenase family)